MPTLACTSCGTLVSGHGSFCPRCGTPVERPAGSPPGWEGPGGPTPTGDAPIGAGAAARRPAFVSTPAADMLAFEAYPMIEGEIVRGGISLRYGQVLVTDRRVLILAFRRLFTTAKVGRIECAISRRDIETIVQRHSFALRRSIGVGGHGIYAGVKVRWRERNQALGFLGWATAELQG